MMKQFLSDLKNALKARNIDSKSIDDIISDYQDMIDSAIEEGLSEAEITKKFGDVQQIAEELAALEEEKQADHKDEPKDVSLDTDFEVEDGYNLYIKLSNDDIVFEESENDKVHINISNKQALKGYTIEFENNTIRIERPKYSSVSSYFKRDKGLVFTILIPKNISMHSLHHETTNGDTKADYLKASRIELITINGDGAFKSLLSDSLRINTVNGDFEIDKGKFDELNISMVNGDVALRNTDVKQDAQLKTVSGDIQVDTFTCDTLFFKTVSGDLQARETYPKKVHLKSVSGDISITNKEKTPFEILKNSSLSGTISIH